VWFQVDVSNPERGTKRKLELANEAVQKPQIQPQAGAGLR